MTWEEVSARGLALADVELSTSYGTPSLKVRVGRQLKLITRLKEDGASIVVFMDMAEKELLLEADPERFFETPHYHGYPALLARLSTADPDHVAAILERTWRHAREGGSTSSRRRRPG